MKNVKVAQPAIDFSIACFNKLMELQIVKMQHRTLTDVDVYKVLPEIVSTSVQYGLAFSEQLAQAQYNAAKTEKEEKIELDEAAEKIIDAIMQRISPAVAKKDATPGE